MFAITVATTVSSTNRPRSFSDTASSARMTSPSTSSVRGDRQAAVGVAVVGDAEVGLFGDHRGPQARR